MIRAVFTEKGRRLAGVSISGHAGYAGAGSDIVCAAVTSAVQLTANGITEVLKLPVSVRVEDNEISFAIPDDAQACAFAFLRALYLHLELLAAEYPKHIQITCIK